MSLSPLVLAMPVAAAALCAVAGRRAALVSVVASLVTSALTLAVAFDSFVGPPRRALGGLVYVDALSGLVLMLVGLVSAMAALYSFPYMRNAVASGEIAERELPSFHVWLQLSIGAMLAVPLMNNLGLMWVAIETTTLFTVLLVAFVRRGHALEAAWKYFMLGAVGLGFALFGLLLTYYAASHGLVDAAGALDWDELRAHAASLDPDLMRVSFVLILIGFGTKAGLAPMHTWLPDAHGQAPTPVSVLLSGALLNCALYGILRFHLLAAGSVGSAFSSDLLVWFGTLSIVVAVPFVLVQHDLKRLLAYSSVEHMGIVALAVGIGGPLALFAAAFHMFNHAIAKTTLFVAAGAIGQRYGTQRLAHLRGAFELAPLPALGLVLGTLAITGVPPFAPFTSEFGVARAGFAGRPAALAGAIVLVAGTALIFGGMLFHVLNVAFRPAPRHSHQAPFRFASVFLGAPLATLLVMGIWLPPLLREGFAAAASVLGVAP
ncbi:MAG TPA: hydrogenase 4 subunit F [Candidatus Limnocylindria bacterium]|nr:hydrogenase 4 subunit F [Candidatus Limnocylindria bacterium]